MWGGLAFEVGRVAREMELVGLHEEAEKVYTHFLKSPGVKPDGDYSDGRGALEWASSLRHDMGYSHDGTHASTGRLLLEREPYKVNIQAVIDACAATGTWIELNCNPYRFDLDWRHWPYAKSKGVKCVINPDAHRTEHANFLRLGAGVARKGWLTKADVMNTLPLAKLMKELGRKRI